MGVTLIQWLDRQSWLHATVRRLRLRALVSRALQARPLIRTYPSGTRVEVADLESFFLSDEIFRRETYRPALEKAGEVRTVMDLGCNVGFFCCYLRRHFGRNNFRGVGIDANPAVLQQARRNLDLNGLAGIELRHGLVGAGRENKSQPFYLYSSHLGSSQFLEAETARTIKGDWKQIDAPVLGASALWREKFGDEPIDLLKIDIEGSEGALIRSDPALFRQARCLVLEWHKWLVREEELFPLLETAGFSCREKLEDGATTELWFFSKKMDR